MNLDELFYKEFRETVNGRRAQMGASAKYQITNLPIPRGALSKEGIPKTPLVFIRGIKGVPFYEALNNTEAQLVKKANIKKRVVNSDGSFRKDDRGNFVTKDVTVKKGFVAILSTVNIQLRKFEETEHGKREIRFPEGYSYVDYIDTNVGRKYIYIVPKSCVYKENMCALIITNNTHRVFYRCCKLMLQNGQPVYVYLIPYKRYSDLSAYRVLNVKASLDFGNEVSCLLRYWIEQGVIFDYRLTGFEDNVRGLQNVAYTEVSGTLSADEYMKYGVSIEQEANDEELMVEY